eukprot:16439509-Heterocapsa_arctica.AAC.1
MRKNCSCKIFALAKSLSAEMAYPDSQHLQTCAAVIDVVNCIAKLSAWSWQPPLPLLSDPFTPFGS